jgi:hypothetical protein
MDPVSTIVTALVNGLTAAVFGRSVEDMVMEGYLALKEVIHNRYGSDPSRIRVAAALDGLEENPLGYEQQLEMVEALEEAGGDRATHLVEMATQLISLIEDPLRILDAVEDAHRQAGRQAIGEVVNLHVDRILAARRDYVVQDRQLLTDLVGGMDELPPAVRDDIRSIHGNIGHIISRVAESIENNSYRDSEEAIRRMPMGNFDQQRASRLVAADKAVHISYQSLRTTVEYFASLNEQILRQVDQELDPEKEANMLLGNAILVYELSDYVISFIRSFEVFGVEEIEKFHAEIEQQISSISERQSELHDRLDGDDIEADVRENVREDNRNRGEALREFEAEWNRYRSEISALNGTVAEVQSRLPTLEVIRENASLQVEVLQLIVLIRFLKQHTQAMKGAVDALKGFRLAPLTPNRVRCLLGIPSNSQ